MHSVNLLDEPVSERFAGVPVLRNPGFLLDPIIGNALLSKARGMYPPLPTAQEFGARGYSMDPRSIAKEARSLLYGGHLPVFRTDVSRGLGGTLSFSVSLQKDLMSALSVGTQLMIQNYLLARFSEETRTDQSLPSDASTALLPPPPPPGSERGTVSSDSTLGSVTSAGSFERRRSAELALIAENDKLKKLCASLERRTREAEGRANLQQARAQRTDQEAKVQKAQLHKATTQLETSRKKLRACKKSKYRWEYKARSKRDFGLNGRKAIEVRNICMDPNRHLEVWEKRKRDPSLAFEFALVLIRGTKEPRPFGGGVRWTIAARYEEFAHFVRTGTEAARRAVHLRETALDARALRTFVVPVARQGCNRRHVLFTSKQKRARAEKAALAQNSSRDVISPGINSVSDVHRTDEDCEMTVEEALEDTRPLEGVRLFDHPSKRTTYREIIPACQLVFSCLVGDLLHDESTERVGLCCDFAKSKGFGCMGAVVMVFQSSVAFEDPLGRKLYDFRVLSFKLPMTQSTNKLTRELFDGQGNLLIPEAAKCLVKSLFIGNAARHFEEHPELWVLACDGATENSGRGNADRARENLCAPGGLYHEVVITKSAWTEVMGGAEKANLSKPLDELFGNSKFNWPGTQTTENGTGVAGDALRSEDNSAADSAADEGTATAGVSRPCQQTLVEPLDVCGPVHKDPKIVQAVSELYVRESKEAINRARDTTLCSLKAAATAAPHPTRFTVFGPFHMGDVGLAQRQRRVKLLADLAKHESEYQCCLHRSREKALRLYEARIQQQQRCSSSEHFQAQPSLSVWSIIQYVFYLAYVRQMASSLAR